MDEQTKVLIRLLAMLVAELSDRVAILTSHVAGDLSSDDAQEFLSAAQSLRGVRRTVLAALEQAFPTTPSQRES
jgi:hypothetical protein